jgi:hypothetical protein
VQQGAAKGRDTVHVIFDTNRVANRSDEGQRRLLSTRLLAYTHGMYMPSVDGVPRCLLLHREPNLGNGRVPAGREHWQVYPMMCATLDDNVEALRYTEREIDELLVADLHERTLTPIDETGRITGEVVAIESLLDQASFQRVCALHMLAADHAGYDVNGRGAYWTAPQYALIVTDGDDINQLYTTSDLADATDTAAANTNVVAMVNLTTGERSRPRRTVEWV